MIYGKGTWDNVVALAVADGDIELQVNETETLKVYAIYSDGTVPTILDNELLTFTSDSDTIATVSNSGVVTAQAAGSTKIEIKATAAPRLSTYGVVTVSD